jgi:hypothetical protein
MLKIQKIELLLFFFLFEAKLLKQLNGFSVDFLVDKRCLVKNIKNTVD